MMPMQTMPMSEDFPSAIFLARLSDVVMNNNVLYRLIRPTEEGTEVVSVNRLVNVVPFRRIYRFDRKDELEQFSNELLRRPLVLQPVVHFGRGLGSGNLACGLCYKDDKWVMMINQTHPKILSRLQMGLDAAKNAMARGQSCEIRFEFSKIVERIYKANLTKTEQENAAAALDLFKSYFRYAEWEYADLIIRYHGYAAMLGRRIGFKEISTLHLTFCFEDLLQPEIGWKTLGAEFFPKPHLAPVDEDEIREYLPAWTVNGISPLEDIGEKAPAATYSYAQAGRLYESFRKKKRRPRPEVGDQAYGGAPSASVPPTVSDGIELKVLPHPDEEDHWQHEYGKEYNEDLHQGYAGGSYPVKPGYTERGGYQNLPHHWQKQQEEDAGFSEEKGAKPKRGPGYGGYGHLYSEVRANNNKAQNYGDNGPYSGGLPKQSPGPYTNSPPATSPGHFRYDGQGPNLQVHAPHTPTPSPYSNANPGVSPGSNPTAPPRAKQRQGSYGNSPLAPSPGPMFSSPRSPGQDPYARPSPRQEDHEYTPLRNQFTRLQMQGSDRSSHSETGSAVADSGISSDSDGHARDGSYEKPRYTNTHQHSPIHKYASDNYGFHHDDETNVSEAMHKHKELIAKMIGGAPPEADSGFHDNRQQNSRDIGGYHPNRSNDLSPHPSKGGIPSPRSPGGYPDYAMSGNRSYGYANDHHANLQSKRQQVDESFI